MLRLLLALVSLAAAVPLSACSQPDPAAEPGAQSASVSKLAISHIRQEKLLCVPTAAAMILAYYGDPHSPRRLKMLASGREAATAEISFDDFTITYYRDIVSAVRKLGYDWEERSFPDDDAGFSRGVALIQDELTKRRPVMIDLSVPYGHTVVVAGIDPAAGIITLVDPGQAAPGEVTLTFDQLKAWWNEHAYGGAFRSLIVTHRKAA